MMTFAVRTFITLFVVMDPIGLGPFFISLVALRKKEKRRQIALRAVLVASGVMLTFALGGAALLGHLHVSLDAFRAAGGILLFKIAIEMVFAQHERETPDEADEARERRDVSVFPLAIPLIAGPGALASVLILAGEAHAYPYGLAVVLGMTALVLVLVYLGLVLSDRTARLLGQTGVNVVTRVFGILLSALAVQYVADGVRGLFFKVG
jgi:multiple antibiotic resistance protein